jgi:LPPG:FO 2-phospho-L-lactate transferase
MITVLAGGVGAARFLEGLVQVALPKEVTVVVNTGDDETFHGLHVSPDIDIVVYTLTGVVDGRQGWGIEGDTYFCLETLGVLGRETWFRLGDRDLATHVHRTWFLRQGRTLSQATAAIAAALGLKSRILPMSDEPAPTYVETEGGRLTFQEYFVRGRHEATVRRIDLRAAERARPAPGVLEAIAEAEMVIVAPSNPLVSIGPVLALAGVRQALRDTTAGVVAVSPIVGGRALKGPADRMLADLGHEASSAGIARLYADFLDTLVLDEVDAYQAPHVEALGVKAVVGPTVMSGPAEKRALAQLVLGASAIGE